MQKDFEGWNIKKQRIDSEMANNFCHPRDIWWCSLGINIGSEQNGMGKSFSRPIIVIRTFSKNVFLGVALTSKKKREAFYFPIGLVNNIESSVILSQIRLIDTKRLIRKLTVLDEKIFEEVKSALQRTLFN